MSASRLSRRSLVAWAVAAGLGSRAAGVSAQAFSRPLEFLVPQPASNPTDIYARKLQPLLQKELGQTVVVENVPGAGGSIGVRRALAAPSDAPMLMIASQTEPILTPLAMLGAHYQPEDLRAIGLITRAPYVLVGRPDLPAATLAELVALARQSSAAKPLAFGHIGQGSMIQLLGIQLARKLGVSLNQISYKGVPPVIQDLMGGHIDLSFLPAGGTTATLIDSGKVRVFGTTGARASTRLPHVLPLSTQDPALADFVYGTWAAVFVARALPEATVQRLYQALSNALKDPDLPAYARTVGTEMAEPMTLEQITRFYQDETRRYRELAREIGLKAE